MLACIIYVLCLRTLWQLQVVCGVILRLGCGVVVREQSFKGRRKRSSKTRERERETNAHVIAKVVFVL